MAQLQYKCPGCGAPINFDAATQKMACEFCSSIFEVAAVEKFNADLARAEQAQASQNANMDPATASSISNNEQLHMDLEWKGMPEQFLDPQTQETMAQFTCNSCGGEIIGSAEVVSTKCPYCNNNFVAVSQLTTTRIPDRMIPFILTEEQMVSAFKQASKGLAFLPRTFREEHKIKEAMGVYLPFWLYDCDLQANIVYSGEQITTWSDSEYEYVETSYYRLHRQGQISFDDVPVSGTKQVNQERTESIEPFDYAQTTPFSPAYLTGHLTNRYDVAPEIANKRADERIRHSTEQIFMSTTTGYCNVTTTDSAIQQSNGVVEYVFLPVWLLNLEFNGKTYPFAINGQTGRVAGEFPISRAKLWSAFLGLALPLSVLAGWIATTIVGRL